MMGKEDKHTPASRRLADALYMLGLLGADESGIQQFINSPEFKEFEKLLKEKHLKKDYAASGCAAEAFAFGTPTAKFCLKR